jgi:cation diffusion facilitator CzcD-associated flavoprotein CzcO
MPALYRSSDIEAVVIGAGPYGLAVAAHLKAAGVSTRVFGEPMCFWDRNMPKGMRLRSPHIASHIADPYGVLSLDHYAAEKGVACGEPLPVETFIDYGLWFQARAIPDLDPRRVIRIEAAGQAFRLILADGDRLAAERVVIATGLANQQFRPAAFDGIPGGLASHTSEHASLEAFRGKRVAVVGRGQSACETAALLTEVGAEVELICRGDIRWLGAAQPSEAWQRELARHLASLVAAPSAVGPFPYSWLVEVPGLVHRLPAQLRARLNARSLRAGVASWLLSRFANVRVNAGRTILGAEARGDQVAVQLDSGTPLFDHVLLATGYEIDISRPGILAPDLRAAIACRGGSPILAAGFESSVPCLHFAGAAAVTSFGPLMRFVAGTSFAARNIAKAMAARRGALGIASADRAPRFGAAHPAERQ